MYVCMYVCMYACMYVCMFVCMHACMYVCKYVRMCVCTCICMHACMYVCMYVCICILKCICVTLDISLALTPQISCEGDQYGLHVTFTLPAHLKDKCPYQLSMAQGIRIHPVLFTKGTMQQVTCIFT